MADTQQVPAPTAVGSERWYALSPDEVTARLGVDPASGLAATTATQRLLTDGPTALPAERSVPGWRRVLDQYAAYMQIILLIAGVLSLVIGEWSTGAVLLLLTVLNAVVGLRQ
ncbi:MAG: cation-transporting P-type ATPase [Acidimicrobiales bacterium]